MIELRCEYLSVGCIYCMLLSRRKITLLSLKLQIWRLLRGRSSLTFRQTIECRFTLKLVRDMIIIYRQMHCTDKYSQHSSTIWPVWLNHRVFFYKLSGCGFESRCCHFRCGTCFKQVVPWHSGKLQSVDSLLNSCVTW